MQYFRFIRLTCCGVISGAPDFWWDSSIQAAGRIGCGVDRHVPEEVADVLVRVHRAGAGPPAVSMRFCLDGESQTNRNAVVHDRLPLVAGEKGLDLGHRLQDRDHADIARADHAHDLFRVLRPRAGVELVHPDDETPPPRGRRQSGRRNGSSASPQRLPKAGSAAPRRGP